jgi:hypothetical protein
MGITKADILQALRALDHGGEHPYGESTHYDVVFEGRRYPPKAVVGLGARRLLGRVMEPREFKGARDSEAFRVLKNLGFDVRRKQDAVAGPILSPRQVYSWDQLGELFRFSVPHLQVAGGMISRPKQNALLIVTYPGGAKSFNYDDRWEGADLIYTGRGKIGPQRYTGQNRALGENARTIFVFEPAGPRLLKFLGNPICIEHFQDTGEDANGQLRPIIRFRLRFPKEATGRRGEPATEDSFSATPHRQPTPFDPSNVPTDPASGESDLSPEELQQRLEQANKLHHDILVALEKALRAASWTGIAQIKGAVDLWAEHDGRRVIFEAKTLTAENELNQSRSALAQLLEYRHLYGAPADRLCVVTNQPLSKRRIRLLEALEVMTMFVADDRLWPDGTLAKQLHF